MDIGITFFYYLNNLGISLHHYAHYPSWHLVKLSRHATTPFTEKVFNNIQDSDYTFLSQFHAWDRELESFLASGGALQQALDKLAQINLIDLPNEWCKQLYRIIDIINLPDRLLKNQPKFIDSIIAKGIEPPACLQPFLRK